MLLAVGVLVAAGFAFDAWFMPARSPHFEKPSAWEALIDSRLVIGVIRLIAFMAGLYVVASIIARMQRGQWLSSVGPFKVDSAMDRLAAENKRLEGELADARETIDALSETLQNALALLEEPGNTAETGSS